MTYRHHEFGEVLRSLRFRAGYGEYGGIRSFIAALELALGKPVAYRTINSYESGQCMPSYGVVSAWLRVTCRTPQELVEAYLLLHGAVKGEAMGAMA